MTAIQNIIGDFLQSLKSKRVVTGILTILFMAAYNYFDLGRFGITEETVAGLVVTVAALLISDTVRPVNPAKLEGDS